MLRNVLFRLAAVFLGAAVTFTVVEVVLQIAAATIPRKARARELAPSHEEIRIVCVGESTTYGKWPAQLEKLLNFGRVGPPIRVINRGTVGIRTGLVADKMEGWLDEDRPHLVITMLGINDEGNVLVYPRGGTRGWIVENSRTFRLLDLLRRTAFGVGVSEKPDGPPPPDDSHIDDHGKAALAKLWWRRPEATRNFSFSELIDIQRQFIALDAGNPVYNVSALNGLVMHHDSSERLDEFFNDQIGIQRPSLDVEAQTREIAGWAEHTGDGFAALRLTTSIARMTDDSDLEQRLLEEAIEDPDLVGLAWLRRVDFATWREGPEAVRRCLIRADEALPDDYQWSLALGDVGFMVEEYDFAIEQFARALQLRPDLPTSHELVILGWLANACEQSGDAARGARFRAQRDELELGRFREYTRHYYQRVVDSVRLRGIPVIAMQYPLLSVASLRKLLDHREDVLYLENRTNFEAALLESGYRSLFSDSFAGSFGHLTDRGNMVVAENVANALKALLPDLEQQVGDPARSTKGSP